MGIKIILDMVLNHTSEQHSWFSESRATLNNPKRDWYIWKDGKNGKPPNNWRAASGGSAWQFDQVTKQYYYHSFFPEQPDLNWRNQEVEDTFFEIFQFWINLGVDGFRLDVVNMIVKDRKLRDNPLFSMIPFIQQKNYTRNRNLSYKIVERLRKLMDRHEDRMLLGEVYVMPPGNAKTAASYLGKGDNLLNLAFDFSLIFQPWNAKRYIRAINNFEKQIPKQGWPCHVLSNHDLFRSINRIPWTKNKIAKAKVAAVLLLTLRGTPFIYYGEEIGMPNSFIPRKEVKDPLGKRFWPFFSGRDKARTPMQWDDGIYSGFSDSKPWLPVDKSFRKTNVSAEMQDENSLFHVYRTIIHLRKKHPALFKGRWAPLLEGENGIICALRFNRDERIIVLLNFTKNTVKIQLQEHLFGEVIFSTHRQTREVKYFRGLSVLPFEASVFIDSAFSRYLPQ
jgi:alpha-glucosidase